ncbi:MAG: GILT family protein, partial [Nanoarchaeota archaeon]|nr:GILT family protein [Nanoarchaeota archaeon]
MEEEEKKQEENSKETSTQQEAKAAEAKPSEHAEPKHVVHTHTQKTKRKVTKKHKKAAVKVAAKKKESLKKKEESIFRSLMPKIKLWHIIVVLLAIFIVYIIVGSQQKAVTTPEGKVKVEFYVMSQCPYGTEVEDAIAPDMASMGDAIDLHIDYIAQEVAPGQFMSLHGEPEVLGNIVQLCAKQYNPDKYVDFIVCQNENAAAI